MPFLLFIETSQRAGAVALAAGDTVDVEPLVTRARHDDDLMPAIDRIVRRAGAGPGDLEAVGVSVGPGGFTGLRIAVSTAKMLAEITGARLVAVPSAHAVAEGDAPADGDVPPIAVALASKRETAWWTLLERQGGRWREIAPPGLRTAATLGLEDAPAPAAVLADEHLPEAIRARCGTSGIPVRSPVFDAAAGLRVASRALAAGDTTSAEALLPIYPRPPEAVRKWRERHDG